MKTSQLEIRLLGPVEILFNQESLKITRKVERAILYYLAVENRPISRTTLIDLLWPEAEQIDPRGTLRTALSRLRKKLSDTSLLNTDLDQVSLNFTRCTVDLLKFEETYQSLYGILSGLPINQALPSQIVSQIVETLALWHGDRVLQGDDLSVYPGMEEWHRILNRDLELHREFLMKRLASHYQACGQLERALDLYTHLGRLNYLDIASHLGVLEILVKSGRHQEAMEYCDTLEIIFERQYNAPLPDVLLERCHSSQRLVEENQTKQGRDWPIPLTMQLPLVGRAAELAQLRAAFFSGGLVKIQGETGAGKTRLVKELFESLSPKPMLILAPARESESTLPLAPIIHGLRRHIPESVWGEIDAVWANQLSLIFPELSEFRSDLSPSPDSQWPSARQHLFDAILQLLGLATSRFGRILFFLDDAHWADDQTIEVLSYLIGQGFFNEQGVLIGAVRTEDKNNAFTDLIDRLQHTQPVRVITVGGLNPDELRILTQQALHQQPSASFIQGLFRETFGNPFWTLEIIHHLLETPNGIDEAQSTGQLPLPSSVHALIRHRLNQLSGESHYILTCTAVLGTDTSVDLLQAVVDLHPHEFITALDSLIRTGMLQTHRADQTNEEKLFFTHEKIQEVVITETAPIHRQILHQRIARLLSQDPRALDQAPVIAEHYLAGGDIAGAFHWYLQAAAHAWTLGAVSDVLWSYRQAEQLLDQAPEGFFSNGDILKLYKHWSDYAFQSNQVDLLEEVGVKLQHYAQNQPDPLMKAVSNLALSNACFLREDYETGLFLNKMAIKDLEHSPDQEILLQALFHQAILDWWTLDFDRIFITANRILTVIVNFEPGSLVTIKHEFNARRMMSEAYFAQGQAEKAYTSAQEIYQMFFHKLDTFDRLRALNMMAFTNFVCGHVSDAISYAQKGLDIAQNMDNTFIEELLLIILSKAEIIQGHLDKAYAHASRAQQLAESSNKIQTIVAANTLMGQIFVVLHNYTQAMHHYRLAQVRQGFFFHSYNGLENNINLLRLLSWTGQHTEAREIAQTTLAVTEEKGMMQLHAQALLAEGFVDLNEGKDIEAEGKFFSAMEIAKQRGLSQEILLGKFHLAMLAFHRKQYDLTDKHLIEVLDQTQSQQMTLLNQFALQLARQLATTKKSQFTSKDIQTDFQLLVDELDSHTQSAQLRQAFLNARSLWKEDGYLP